MRPGLGRVLLAALLAMGSAFAIPAASPAVEGSFEDVSTRIAVKLDDRLSSQDNKKGDVFHFELTGSVILNGVALGAGTRGHGVVSDVASGEGPKHGFITLEARSIDAGGEHYPVGLAPGSLDVQLSRESRGFSMPLGAAAPIYVGPSRDNNVVYPKGTPFFVISPPPVTPEPDPSQSAS